MRTPYLEVTYRRGKPLAAYLYLPRAAGDRSSHTRRLDGGLIVDYTAAGKPIGIEMTAPGQASVADLNQVLAELFPNEARPALTDADLAPLRAA